MGEFLPGEKIYNYTKLYIPNIVVLFVSLLFFFVEQMALHSYRRSLVELQSHQLLSTVQQLAFYQHCDCGKKMVLIWLLVVIMRYQQNSEVEKTQLLTTFYAFFKRLNKHKEYTDA